MMTSINIDEKIKNSDAIVFVCSGNIIRSAFAELWARHKEISIPIYSIGTRYQNNSIHNMSARALRERGVNGEWIDQFQPTHLNDFDQPSDNAIYLIMTKKHRKDLVDAGFDPDKIFLITQILGEQREIADPYFEGNYDSTFDTLDRAVSRIVELT